MRSERRSRPTQRPVIRKHQRLPRWVRLVSKLVPAFDFCLLLYFFSGITNVGWASPLSAALAFAVLLAVTVTGISFAFFRFTGDRLQQYKNDIGVIPSRGLDEATTVAVGLTLGAMMILAALIFIRIRAGVLGAFGSGAGGIAIIISLALALVSILANTLVIAVHALDGSAGQTGSTRADARRTNRWPCTSRCVGACLSGKRFLTSRSRSSAGKRSGC